MGAGNCAGLFEADGGFGEAFHAVSLPQQG
jgi:hypothetical protein